MKIFIVLDHIDSGHIAQLEFQRGYVWNRDQVRGLLDSPYRRHPVGGPLVCATESRTAAHRGDQPLAAGIAKLLFGGAVLLNEDAATITLASQAEFRCFTDESTFRRCVTTEVLAETAHA